MLYVFIGKNMYKCTINQLLVVSNILPSCRKSPYNSGKYDFITLL